MWKLKEELNIVEFLKRLRQCKAGLDLTIKHIDCVKYIQPAIIPFLCMESDEQSKLSEEWPDKATEKRDLPKKGTTHIHNS